MPVGNSLLGIFIGGGEHAHVHRRFGFAAQAADLAVLEHPQQLGLGGRRHFADFVQKQRAAIGQLKAADAPLGGSREGASLVPENLALHKRFRDGGAVDGHEGPVGARRKLMQCAGQDLLACTRLAGNQDGGGGRSDLLHQAHDVLHRFGGADEFSDAPSLPQLPAQRSHLLLIVDLAKSPVEQRPKDGSFERLFDVPESARLNGGHGAFFAALAGDDNRGNGGQFVAKALEKRQAVYAGKLDVRNQNGGMIVGETSQRVFRAGNAQDIQAPALEQSLVAAARILFIFNDKHAIG